MNDTKNNTNEQTHHFFATTAVSWSVGLTRQEAIEGAARIAGDSIIKANAKANKKGLYCWTCRVEAPKSTAYEIRNYAPVGVETKEPLTVHIVNVKGHVVVEG